MGIELKLKNQWGWSGVGVGNGVEIKRISGVGVGMELKLKGLVGLEWSWSSIPRSWSGNRVRNFELLGDHCLQLIGH